MLESILAGILAGLFVIGAIGFMGIMDEACQVFLSWIFNG